MEYPSSQNAQLILVFALIYLGLIVVLTIASYLLYAISLSLFFRKVGVARWIAWVPIYSRWKWLEVGGQSGYWALFELVPSLNIVTLVFTYLSMWRSNIAFGQSTGMFVLGIFFPFVWLFVMAARSSVYEPQLITAAGYSPPLAGFGSADYSARQHPST